MLQVNEAVLKRVILQHLRVGLFRREASFDIVRCPDTEPNWTVHSPDPVLMGVVRTIQERYDLI